MNRNGLWSSLMALVLLVSGSLHTQNAGAQNTRIPVVPNGGFEATVQLAHGNWHYQPSDASWVFDSAGIAVNGSPWFDAPTKAGNRAAFIQGVGGSIRQTVDFASGGRFALQFWLIGRSGYGSCDLSVRVDGVEVLALRAARIRTDRWVSYTTALFPVEPGPHTLSFVCGSGGDANAIDQIQLVDRATAALDLYEKARALDGVIDALKNHLTGQAPLGPNELNLQTDLFLDNQIALAKDAALLAKAFDFVAYYESTAGALFVNADSKGGFDNLRYVPGQIDGKELVRAIFTVQQALHDEAFVPELLENNPALVAGRKFASADFFPGACPPPTDPGKSWVAKVNASMPQSWGRRTAWSRTPARRPTGYYLAPGSVASVTVPNNMVNRGFSILVGAHDRDKFLNHPTQRFYRIATSTPITRTTTRIANPFGGGIYIVTPYLADLGVQEITLTNVVPAPYWSAQSFDQSKLADWVSSRTNPAPWADFVSDKFMLQVPRSWIYNYADPKSLMQDWDARMDTVSDLLGYPRLRNSPSLYLGIDLDLMAPGYGIGYPQMNNLYHPDNPTDGNASHWFLQPGTNFWPIEFHEMGHAELFGREGFPGEGEASVNILTPALLNQLYGVDLDRALGLGRETPHVGRGLAAVNWMVTPNFRAGLPMDISNTTKDEVRYQVRGYAKYGEIAALFGWDKLSDHFRRGNLRAEAGASGDDLPDTDRNILSLSLSAGADLRPLIHFWGVHPGNRVTLKSQIGQNALPPSQRIYDRLAYYASQIPANNAQFQAHAAAFLNLPVGSIGTGESPDYGEGWYHFWLHTYNETHAQAARDALTAIIAEYFPDGRPATDSTLTVLLAQVPVFGAPPKILVGSSAPLEVVGGQSGNPVLLASTTPGICSVSGNTVTALAVGDCVVRANQGGDARYAAAAPVSFSFPVHSNSPSFTLTLEAPVGGTVSSVPSGIECGANGTKCSASFANGVTVALTASPGLGVLFSGWGGACSGNTVGCSVTMNGANSVRANFIASLAPPGAPTLNAVLAGIESASLSFSAPATNGLPLVIDYRATCRADGQATKTAIGTTSPITLSGMVAGGRYSCTVAARNGAGSGTASSALPVEPKIYDRIGAPPVPNGGFEVSEPLSPYYDHQFVDQPSQAIWNFDRAGIAVSGSTWYRPEALEGSRAAYLRENGASITQSIDFGSAGRFAVRFYVVGRIERGGRDLSVQLDGVEILFIPQEKISLTDWMQVTTKAFEVGAGRHTLAFVGGSASGNDAENTDVIDRVEIVNGATLAPGLAFLSVSKSGLGTVTSSPSGIVCGTSCSAAFANGSPVTLTARAEAGHVFTGWGGSCAGVANTCSLTMDTGHSVSASFAALSPPPALTGPTCSLAASSLAIQSGASVTLTAHCGPGVTSYTWRHTGFASDTASGTVTPFFSTIYTVQASGSNGPGPVASVVVTVSDTLALAAPRANYTLSAAGGALLLTDKGSGVSQSLAGLKRLKFTDTSLAFDIDGVAGKTARLYQAAFNRTPDLTGLGFQMATMELWGYELDQLAQVFMDSPEFSDRYGNLGDQQFVTLLYANVLRRAPDAGGLAYYLDGLARRAFSRAHILASFSESPENQDLTRAAMQSGIEYVPVTDSSGNGN